MVEQLKAKASVTYEMTVNCPKCGTEQDLMEDGDIGEYIDKDPFNYDEFNYPTRCSTCNTHFTVEAYEH